MKTLVALYDETRKALLAAQELHDHGLDDDDVTVLRPNAREGELVGIVSGLGPRSPALSTPAARLEHLGVPHDQAKRYARRVSGGSAAVVVRCADTTAPEIEAVLERHGPV